MNISPWSLLAGPLPGRGWSVLCEARRKSLLLTVRNARKQRIGQLKLPSNCQDPAALEALLEALARCSDRRLHVTVRAVAARSVSTFELVFIEQSPDFGSSPWLSVDWDVPEYGLRPATAHVNPMNQEEDCHDLG